MEKLGRQYFQPKQEQLSADTEVIKDLKEMLEQHGHKVEIVVVFENVYIFETEDPQKLIVHHDPVYDNGDFYYRGEAYEYFL